MHHGVAFLFATLYDTPDWAPGTCDRHSDHKIIANTSQWNTIEIQVCGTYVVILTCEMHFSPNFGTAQMILIILTFSAEIKHPRVDDDS